MSLSQQSQDSRDSLPTPHSPITDGDSESVMEVKIGRRKERSRMSSQKLIAKHKELEAEVTRLRQENASIRKDTEARQAKLLKLGKLKETTPEKQKTTSPKDLEANVKRAAAAAAAVEAKKVTSKKKKTK